VCEIITKLKNKEIFEEFLNTFFINVDTWNMQIKTYLKNQIVKVVINKKLNLEEEEFENTILKQILYGNESEEATNAKI